MERHLRRPIMGTLHAAFSGGAAVGALVGGAVDGAGVPVLTHFALIATPLTVVGALYLVEALGTSSTLGATGFVAFSAAMVVGRLSQDRLVHRLGDDAVRRTGALVAAAAMAVALLTDDPRAAVVALGAVGVGLAAVFPVMLSAAGRLPGIAPAQAVAVVSATAYGALLAGPPLIELLADATTLRAALWTVVGALALIAVLRTRSPTGDGWGDVLRRCGPARSARPQGTARRSGAAGRATARTPVSRGSPRCGPPAAASRPAAGRSRGVPRTATG